MELLSKNLAWLLGKQNSDLSVFLSQNSVNHPKDLSVRQLEFFCAEHGIGLEDLLFSPLFFDRNKLEKLKFLILDIDGVMTDGGMYFTESGDQIKKYNTKDGMAIKAMVKKGFRFGIISSGYKLEVVKSRADVLGIKHVYVGREPKINVLNSWLKELYLDLSQIGIIGDDINDLEVMQSVGFSACPADAVSVVKSQVDLVLQNKGGQGCIREFIDAYLLKTPLK